MSFQNKVVIVTGASSGIGANTAVELAKQGANVVIVARNQTKLDNVAAGCAKVGKSPLVINADLVNDVQVKKIIDTTINKFGKLDVLINNAGFGISQLFENVNALNTFDQVLALNLRSVVHLTHLAAPHLIKTKGNVVNISSIVALKYVDKLWAYCTAKAGLDHFSRCIAKELAPKGVRVNTVNPGPVRTDFVENMGIQEVDKHYADMANNMPLKRVSEPEEITDMILFLASNKAVGVTGSTWVSDDGFLLL